MPGHRITRDPAPKRAAAGWPTRGERWVTLANPNILPLRLADGFTHPFAAGNNPIEMRLSMRSIHPRPVDPWFEFAVNEK